MQLWFATTISLDENENEMWIHIVHNWWHQTIDENLVVLWLLMWFTSD
jgi:hypothetical protein